MVNRGANALDATFGALCDPTRRAILARLALGGATVTELAAPFTMSLPAVLKHVGALEAAGLVLAHKDGRVRRCRLEAAPLEGAASWIGRYRQFWDERFDALASYLRETGGEEASWRQDPPRARAKPSGSRSRGGSTRRGRGSSGRSRRRRV
jgi:DNA-binding transcriptional ArsR family regulator